LDIIMKQKRISESGTQQLLLDTYNIKTMLLGLHHLGLPPDTSSSSSSSTRSVVPPMYMKLVTAKVAHIEVVLKLAGTPEDMLLERFKIMWPEGGASDLVAVLGLQGVRRGEARGQQIMEQFGLDTGRYLEGAREDGGEGGTGGSIATGIGGIGGEGLDSKSHPSSSSSSSSMANSMRSATQDFSSSTRNALGDLTKSFKFGRNN
jgi:hypothetical protein